MTAALLEALAGVVGPTQVLTGDATAGFAVDWTGRFQGHTPAVIRPGSTDEVAAVLTLCSQARVAVVPQGGNTGLVGGGVPLHGEVVLSLTRLNRLGEVDLEASQVTAEAGVTLQRVADAHPSLDLGITIASRESATVGGAVATNAGGLRVLRNGPMRAQIRGLEAVLSDGTVVSHLSGLTKDNTGYDYPSLLAGSEGTLAVITRVRLKLVPRPRQLVTAIIGLTSLDELHRLARRAVRDVAGLESAEFFTEAGLGILVAHAGLRPPLPQACACYLLLEADGVDALEQLAELAGDRPVAVAESGADRERLWAYRERHPEAAGFLGVPVKLDVSVPAAQWVRLASGIADVVAGADPGASVITFGHVADGNVHVNIVPAAPADGRHEDAVFGFVASLGGSISAEHGIGALKARWLPLARSDAERQLFARIRAAFDPAGTLNPYVLPRLSVVRAGQAVQRFRGGRMSRQTSRVVADMCYLEGPRWHDQRVWFSDFYLGRVYSAAEDGSDLRVEAEVPGQPSGLGWLPDGRLLIVSMRDARVLRRENDGTLACHADLSGYVHGHLNDMVVDARGRAYVGEFGFDLMAGDPFEPAVLLRVDPDGTVTRAAEDMWFPNGSVITEDGTLLVCETFGNRVSAFDIADDGSLANRRAWATFADPPTEREFAKILPQVVVAPDGCCLDAEGALWVADAVGGRAVRVLADGEIADEVQAGTGVFACALGGADGRTLYLCAAPDFDEGKRKNAREGCLLAARVDAPHAGLP